MATEDVLRGTLDLLVLRILREGDLHGWGISQQIEQTSREVLRVGQGALYPALHRLEKGGFVDSYWGMSENNRRARYYELTAAGARRLETEEKSWQRFSRAVDDVLEATRG